MSTENHVLDRYDFENEKLLEYNEIYDRIYNETLQDLDNITEQILSEDRLSISENFNKAVNLAVVLSEKNNWYNGHLPYITDKEIHNLGLIFLYSISEIGCKCAEEITNKEIEKYFEMK